MSEIALLATVSVSALVAAASVSAKPLELAPPVYVITPLGLGLPLTRFTVTRPVSVSVLTLIESPTTAVTGIARLPVPLPVAPARSGRRKGCTCFRWCRRHQ